MVGWSNEKYYQKWTIRFFAFLLQICFSETIVPFQKFFWCSIPPCLTKIILLFYTANVAAYTTQVVRLCMRSGRKCFTTSTFYVKAHNQKTKLSKSNVVYQVFTRSWILGKGNLLGEKMERKVGKVERSKLETSVENGHTKVSCLCMHSWILHEQTEKENVQVGK